MKKEKTTKTEKTKSLKSTSKIGLCRSEDDAILGGVALCVADFLGLDCTLVRILWLLTAFWVGTGILIYIALWIVIPSCEYSNKFSVKYVKMGTLDWWRLSLGRYLFRQKKVGKVGSVFVIFLGIILLLNTIHILPWCVWANLLRYWPVILILGGIDLILRHTILGRLVTTFIVLVTFSFLFLVLLMSYTNTRRVLVKDFPWIGTPMNSLLFGGNVSMIQKELIVNNKANVNSREMTFVSNKGKMSILDDSDLANELCIFTKYQLDQETTVNQNKNDGLLVTEFSPQNKPIFDWFGGFSSDYDIVVGNSQTKTDFILRVNSGSLRSLFDEQYISDIVVDVNTGTSYIEIKDDVKFDNDLDIKVKTGSVTVDLSNSRSLPDNIEIDLTTGSVSVLVPSCVGLDVQYNMSVGEVIIDSERYIENGHYQRSATSCETINVVISVNTGKVELE